MSAAPLLSIVVPSRSGEVAALRAQLARQSFLDWELLVNTHPFSPGHARNLGAAEARGRWLVFLDDDVQLGHDRVLADLVHALERAGPRAVVGVPCRLLEGATAFQRRYVRESFAPEAEGGSGRLMEVHWRDTVNGRCLAMSRELFDRLEGFDARLPSGEEPELLYRLCRQGGRVCLLRSSWVAYAPPASPAAAIRKTLWYERGNAQVARKHPEAGYRMALRSRWHAAGYLVLRTAALPLLLFVKVSYHYRRPVAAFRPIAALLSYVGAWAYCWHWFASLELLRPSRAVRPSGGPAAPSPIRGAAG